MVKLIQKQSHNGILNNHCITYAQTFDDPSGIVPYVNGTVCSIIYRTRNSLKKSVDLQPENIRKSRKQTTAADAIEGPNNLMDKNSVTFQSESRGIFMNFVFSDSTKRVFQIESQII